MFSKTKYVQNFMWDKSQTFLVASMVFYDWRPRPLVAWALGLDGGDAFSR